MLDSYKEYGEQQSSAMDRVKRFMCLTFNVDKWYLNIDFGCVFYVIVSYVTKTSVFDCSVCPSDCGIIAQNRSTHDMKTLMAKYLL